MAILDFLKRKKKNIDLEPLPEITPPASYKPLPTSEPAYQVQPQTQTNIQPRMSNPEMEVVISKIENLRMQYEAINARLQNIERMVTEIRSFCK